MKNIQELSIELKLLHKQRLQNQFDDININSQDKAIDITTKHITNKFRNVEFLLKKLNKLKNNRSDNGSQVQLKIQQNIQNNFAKKIQSLTVAFRSSQKVSVVYILWVYCIVVIVYFFFHILYMLYNMYNL